MPYTLHLNYLINREKGRARRRRAKNNVEREGDGVVRQNVSLIKLHPTLREEERDVDVRAFVEGVVKSNGKQQYGMGYEAVRLWTAKHDHLLGDRALSETDINENMPHIVSLRRVFWDLLPLVPA